MPANASARRAAERNRKSATPYSVTTYCTSARGAVTRPREMRGTTREAPPGGRSRQRDDRGVVGELCGQRAVGVEPVREVHGRIVIHPPVEIR
jgi:hypothetical protein